MRILLINPGMGIGGAERVVSLLAPALQKNSDVSVELLIVGNRQSSAKQTEAPVDVRVTWIPCSRTLFGMAAVLRHIVAGDYDVVISNQRHLNVLVALLFVPLSIFGAKVRLIVVEHEVTNFVPVVSASMVNRFLEKLTPWTYRAASAVVVLTEAQATVLRSSWPMLATRVHVIWNPVVTEGFNISDHLEIGARDSNLVVVVGRLVPVKDIRLAIAAFAFASRKRALRMIIVGDGPEMASLKEFSAACEVFNRIEFIGSVQDPSKYYKMAGILLQTSLTESLPNVLIEAMSFGCGVVAVDCPFGPRVILDHGRLGSLVASRRPEDIGTEIINQLENPIDEGLLKTSAQRFAVGAAANSYLELSKKIVRTR